MFNFDLEAYNKINMKKIIALLSILSIVSFAFSETNDKLKEDVPEIGIVEHLDTFVPSDVVFTDENNQEVKLIDLIDKPTVLSFVYFDCPGLCSPLLEGVSKVIDETDLELGKDYQLITISFNTKDTPEKAIEKKKNFALKISKDKKQYWMYLTGTEENIKKITESIGFYYQKQGVDFAHPSAIYILSPKGKITRYLYGLDFLPFDFKMAIIESSEEISRPTINRVLQYCFSYDPQGKRYGLDIIKVSATVILFFLLIFVLILVVKKRKKSNR